MLREYICIVIVADRRNLLLFLGQNDDFATLEVQYLPSQRRDEYCTSRVVILFCYII